MCAKKSGDYKIYKQLRREITQKIYIYINERSTRRYCLQLKILRPSQAINNDLTLIIRNLRFTYIQYPVSNVVSTIVQIVTSSFATTSAKHTDVSLDSLGVLFFIFQRRSNFALESSPAAQSCWSMLYISCDRMAKSDNSVYQGIVVRC